MDTRPSLNLVSLDFVARVLRCVLAPLVGVLRHFPMFLLAAVIVCAGLAVRDLFFHAADQLVSVQSALSGQ